MSLNVIFEPQRAHMDEREKSFEGKAGNAEQIFSAHGEEGAAQAGVAVPVQARDTAAEREEAKLLRRLQMMMNMVMGVIAQDRTLSYDEAAAMVADARTAALAMFPGKELAYDLIWKPRFERLMRERFRLV